MKVGLLFGSFNPVHVGHLIIANTMIDQAKLDKVWMVITPQSPFKINEELLNASDRLMMVDMAIMGNEKLKTQDVEFILAKPNYTCDTLAFLRNRYPENQFDLIIGEDNLLGLNKWKEYQSILDHHRVFVYPRPYTEAAELKDHPQIRLVNCPLLDISSTYIRECIRSGSSIKYLVPESVERYIFDKKLFT